MFTVYQNPSSVRKDGYNKGVEETTMLQFIAHISSCVLVHGLDYICSIESEIGARKSNGLNSVTFTLWRRETHLIFLGVHIDNCTIEISFVGVRQKTQSVDKVEHDKKGTNEPSYESTGQTRCIALASISG